MMAVRERVAPDREVYSFGDPPTTQKSTSDNLSTSQVFRNTNDGHLSTKSDKRDTSSSSPSTVSNGPTGPPLHHRSCVTCRRRKVRCDKRDPCANCARASIECVYPNPGRAPRKARKAPDTELLARLRRLEGVVQSLGKDVDGEGSLKENSLDVKREAQASNAIVDGEDKENQKDEHGRRSGMCPKMGVNSKPLEEDFGRLVVEEGKSRYVSNSFWASLSDEVEEMKDILEPDSDGDDFPSPDGSSSSQSANHQGFIFSFNSTMVNLRALHPPPSQILTMWQIYKSNVEPLVKILHLPSMSTVIANVSGSLDNLNKATEALMFAIYLSAVTSLSPDECGHLLSEDKGIALSKYRFATEQALARAGFLNTQDRIVLAAFVLFLVCVRHQDDARLVWTLTGIAIRIAFSLGLHRDGTHFGLTPFETEMRRRIWWQVVILDVRAAEDHGTDPSITEHSFDTKLPLNINDADLDPESPVVPDERIGCTEQTFCLIRYEVSFVMRRLCSLSTGPIKCREWQSNTSVAKKEEIIENFHKYLEEKYLQYCDMNIPLYWVTTTVARLVMSKMWLIVHHPFKREDGGANLPQETKDRLFVTCVEVLEFCRLLGTERSTIKWGWLFRTYVQWHAVAYILSELCTRTKGETVDRAWNAIDSVFADWGGIIVASKRGMLWKPLRKLMAKARASRMREVERNTRFPKDGTLGPVADLSAVAANGSVRPAVLDTTTDAFEFTPDRCATLPISGGPNVPLDGMQPMTIPSQSQQGQVNSDPIDRWIMDDATLLQDPLGDERLDWSGWDDMVRDFQMEVQQDQGMERGPVLGGMTNWW